MASSLVLRHYDVGCRGANRFFSTGEIKGRTMVVARPGISDRRATLMVALSGRPQGAPLRAAGQSH